MLEAGLRVEISKIPDSYEGVQRNVSPCRFDVKLRGGKGIVVSPGNAIHYDNGKGPTQKSNSTMKAIELSRRLE